jgi:AAA domain-containing protein
MELLEQLLDHLQSVKRAKNGYTAKCPGHDDQQASLSICAGNDGRVLLRCFAGCKVEQIVSAVGLTLADLFPRNGNGARKIVATYDYQDERGTLLFQSVRYEPKDFTQRRPDGHGGWVWNLAGVRRVPYRLRELLTADPSETVFLDEGEKDTDNLRKIGLTATTNPQGAGKWRKEYSQYLAGRVVVILPDNDEAGEQHALQVARALLPVAAAVKIVRLPGLPPKGDVSDWLAQGHTKEELIAMVGAAPVLQEEDLRTEHKHQGDKDSEQSPWLRAKSAPDFLAEEEKEFQGLAKDLLAPGAITLIDSPKGIGKTQVIHAVAVALATGGSFRGEQVKAVKVLLLNRENPVSTLKKRLRAWGAIAAENLNVLTRQDAPDLNDRELWAQFPAEEYDVLIVDSVGASTEGITEKEGKQNSEVLATLLDLALRDIAILLLQNTEKTGTNIRGRGEWADRADIQYEVRDATGFIPSGKRPWWLELPADGAANWAERAARRKGRTEYRLAFIPAKFRIAAEPDPFCLEISLPEGELWTLRDVTAEVIQSGEEAIHKAEEAKSEKLEKAAAALAVVVKERAASGDPILKEEATEFL